MVGQTSHRTSNGVSGLPSSVRARRWSARMQTARPRGARRERALPGATDIKAHVCLHYYIHSTDLQLNKLQMEKDVSILQTQYKAVKHTATQYHRPSLPHCAFSSDFEPDACR